MMHNRSVITLLAAVLVPLQGRVLTWQLLRLLARSPCVVAAIRWRLEETHCPLETMHFRQEAIQ
jgi:hypothetical protein